MSVQFIEIAEQAARGTVAGGESFLPLPVTGQLRPKFNPVDEPRKEFRGADTGQGDSTVIRRESQVTHALEFNLYPCAALGLLLKHALGIAETRNVLETTAYRGLVRPENLPFGTGATLGTKALMVRVNYHDGSGTTKSRIYHGLRITKMSLSGEGTSEVKCMFEMTAPGTYVTSEGAATSTPDFSTFPSPFNNSDCLLYIGTGISRTGTAPSFTDIAAGTMDQFIPDSWQIDIELGREDAVVMDGVRGPNKTKKTSQLAVTVSCPIDYEDPTSGFSSHDELEALLSAVRTSSLLFVMDNGELAGDTSENYQFVLDLAACYLKPADIDFNTEGKQPTTTLEFSSLYDGTAEYTFAVLTVDKVSAY